MLPDNPKKIAVATMPTNNTFINSFMLDQLLSLDGYGRLDIKGDCFRTECCYFYYKFSRSDAPILGCFHPLFYWQQKTAHSPVWMEIALFLIALS